MCSLDGESSTPERSWSGPSFGVEKVTRFGGMHCWWSWDWELPAALLEVLVTPALVLQHLVLGSSLSSAPTTSYSLQQAFRRNATTWLTCCQGTVTGSPVLSYSALPSNTSAISSCQEARGRLIKKKALSIGSHCMLLLQLRG